MDGTWKYDDNKDETKAINYWWGLSAEVIDVIYSQNLPIGTQKLLTMLKRAIATGGISSIFRNPLFTEWNDSVGSG